MISINNLDIQYGKKHLFNDLSARVNNGDRIGLVGVNGTGKSTLFKILAGLMETDAGVVVRSKRSSIGYLPQEISKFKAGRTVYQEAETAFAAILAAQKKLEGINIKLGEMDPADPAFPQLLTQQGDLQNRIDQSNIFRIRSEIEKVLGGLGFKDDDYEKDCVVFSGGWLMRLMLAKHLLAQPDFLLLDEPTNHLDIESLTWLEEFLKSYHGALVIISHDRAFLDNITNMTWELSLGKLTPYNGNYSKYLVLKEERLEVLQAAYTNQQAKIQQTKRFIERFRAKSTKAKQVQSRVKQLAKIELIELEDTERQIAFRFPPSPPSGRLAIATEKLSKTFGKNKIFSDLTFELSRGDKLAVVGVNGAGKSTFVKLLAGLINTDEGKIRLGHHVTISYFGQHQAQDLDPKYTALETMSHVEGEKTITQTRSILGAFLFQGDDVDKKVEVLSGGEKSRLALAKMIISPANLLIMDEPTNHLDMTSQDILQDALGQYDGSIIVVSHNRFFLDQFVNKVLEIKDGSATLFEGNISYYLEKARERAEAEKNDDAQAAKAVEKTDEPEKNAPPTQTRGKKARQAMAKVRQEKNRKIGPLKKTMVKLEEEIEKLESRKEELEKTLADPELYKDQELFADQSIQYGKIEKKLNRTYQKWETTQGEIDKIEASFENSSPLS